MRFPEFISTLHNSKPNTDWFIELQALCLDKNGFWDEAHKLIQSFPGKGSARVHAYLHRKEGDEWNANYWYARTDDSMPDISLKEEWEYLVKLYVT